MKRARYESLRLFRKSYARNSRRKKRSSSLLKHEACSSAFVKRAVLIISRKLRVI